MSGSAPRALLTVAVLLTAVVSRTPSAAVRDDVTDAAVTRLEEWTRAVTEHTPGQLDGPITIIRSWTFDQRAELNPAMLMFLDALTRARLSDVRKKGATPPRPNDRVRSLAEATFQSIGAAAFLQRAAVLHGDSVP